MMSLAEAKENFIEVMELNTNAMRNAITACKSYLGLDTGDEKGFPDDNLLRIENLMQTTMTLVADYRHNPLKFLKFSKYHNQSINR